MSELNETRWAVLSERGRERGDLNYESAAALVDRLRAEKVRGLSIVSNEAAARLTTAGKLDSNEREVRHDG